MTPFELYIFCKFNADAHKVRELSATRLKMFMKFKELKLVEETKDGIVTLTEQGTQIICELCHQFQELAS